MVLVVLIATAWLVVVLFAVMMCRLAARSDDSQAVALADRIAMGHRSAQGSAEGFAEPLRSDQPPTYRATG